jgi:hypothetical protein
MDETKVVCTHETSIVLAGWPRLGLTKERCTWGCGAVYYMLRGADGVRRPISAGEAVEMITRRVQELVHGQ